MKLSILGNSNSILRDGWLSQLRRLEPGLEVSNLSIGGSPSPALLYRAINHSETIQNSDLCIVEPTVVDHGEGWQNYQGVKAQALALLKYLEYLRSTALVLCLPRNPEHCQTESPGMAAWKDAAQEMGVTAISATDSIRALANELSIPVSQLWADNMGHQTSQSQERIARDLLPAVFAQTPLSSNTQISQPDHFSILAASFGFETIVKETSLTRSELCRLPFEQEIPLNLPPENTILGIAVDYGSIDPHRPPLIEFLYDDGRKESVDISNKFLKEGVSNKLTLMFQRISIPGGAKSFRILPPQAGEAKDNLLIEGFLAGRTFTRSTERVDHQADAQKEEEQQELAV